MSVFDYVLGVLIILLSIVIVLLVLFQQSPKGSGISALTGGDSYYNKNMDRSRDAVFSRFTKYGAIVFFAIAIIANLLPRFM